MTRRNAVSLKALLIAMKRLPRVGASEAYQSCATFVINKWAEGSYVIVVKD
jgi:hypothetical protein